MKMIKVKTADAPGQDFEAEQLRKAAANKILKLYGDFRAAQREAERMHKLQNSEHTKRIMKRFEEADFYIRALVNSF